MQLDCRDEGTHTPSMAESPVGWAYYDHAMGYIDDAEFIIRTMNAGWSLEAAEEYLAEDRRLAEHGP